MAQIAASACQWFGAAIETVSTDLSSKIAQVLDGLRPAALRLLDRGGQLVGELAVGIADVGDLDPRLPAELGGMHTPASPAADHGVPDRLIGRGSLRFLGLRPRAVRTRGDSGRRRDHRFLEELPSGDPCHFVRLLVDRDLASGVRINGVSPPRP